MHCYRINNHPTATNPFIANFSELEPKSYSHALLNNLHKLNGTLFSNEVWLTDLGMVALYTPSGRM